MKSLKWSFILWLGLAFYWPAQGFENRCITRSTGSVKSLCKGRKIPASQARNFHQRSQRLACTSNADHYIRRPQKFNFAEWENLRSSSSTANVKKAWNMRRALPDIAWSGHIPYATVEVWQWEECSLGTSGAECGWEQVCNMVQVPDYSCNSDGQCTTTYRSELQCHDEPKTCYYDHVRYEEWHCSNEIMSFEAKFERPSESEWNINSHKYAEYLPNKYDLLPGEIEDVQVFNSRDNMSSTMRPIVRVGNAWNEYRLNDIKGDNSVACKQDTDYKIDVTVHTIQRDTNKSSPNAFDLPVDHKGNPMAPLRWQTTEADGENIQVKPNQLLLLDKSAAVVKSVSRHSYRATEREQLKAELGKEGNSDYTTLAEELEIAREEIKDKKLENKEDKEGEEEDVKSSGFMKNTYVRIRIEKDRWWFYNTNATHSVYADDGDAVVPTLNVLSKDQEIRNSDFWAIDLEGAGLYDWKTLNDGRRYIMYIAMYQRGVPFYRQKCSENMDQKNCSWQGPLQAIGKYFDLSGGHSLENEYYSDEMAIPFHTDYGYDDRSVWQWFSDAIDFEFDFLFQRRAPKE